jgi:hypothetical protein
MKLRRSPAIALLLSLAFLSCGGEEPEEQRPAPSFAIASPVDSTITPTPPAAETAYRLVFQEFGATEDKIWRLSPQDPTNREQLATITHREGWSVKPSLSPDSRHIAYVAIPEGAIDPSYQGELFMLDLESQQTELVHRGVDHRYRPMWTPDGQLLYARRLQGMETVVLQVLVSQKPAPDQSATPSPAPSPSPTRTPFYAFEFPEETPFVETPFVEPTPEGETPTPTPTETPVKTILQAHMGSVLTFIPVGFADDGKSMYYVQVQGGTGGGTLVFSYAPATTEGLIEDRAKATPTPTPFPADAPPQTPQPTPVRVTYLVQLTDQIARDYDLSPDRKHLSYLAQEIVDGEFVLRSFVADLVGRTAARVPAEGLPPGSHFRPLWHPDGNRLAVGLLPTGIETGAVALVPIGGGPPGFLPAPERGFDVPASWAPDSTFLAVTNYSGNSLANLGDQRIDLVAPSGQRIIVAEGTQFEVIGWFPPPQPSPTPS